MTKFGVEWRTLKINTTAFFSKRIGKSSEIDWLKF